MVAKVVNILQSAKQFTQLFSKEQRIARMKRMNFHDNGFNGLIKYHGDCPRGTLSISIAFLA